MEMQNDHSPLVSVIIPVYNVARYLHEALDSVIGQTYGNLEILLVDDGSTDDSGRICDDYAGKDGRIRLIRQENRGLSAARNVALERAAGEYVVFLDPDDAFHPSFVEMLLAAIRRSNSEMALCKYSIQKTESKMIQKNDLKNLYQPLIDPGIYDRVAALRALAERRMNLSVWNKLYRKELWDGIRFPDGHVYEDMETAFQIAERCETCCVIGSALYYHRKRPGSITATFSKAVLSDLLLAQSQVLSFIRSHIPDVFTEEMLRKQQASFLRSLMALFAKEKEVDAKENLRKLIIKIGASADPGKMSFRTNAGYQMVCHCPGLLRVLYPLYDPVRQLFFKIFGR